jgi:hypothetical protein
MSRAVTLLNSQRQIVLAMGGGALSLGDTDAGAVAVVLERMLHPDQTQNLHQAGRQAPRTSEARE